MSPSLRPASQTILQSGDEVTLFIHAPTPTYIYVYIAMSVVYVRAMLVALSMLFLRFMTRARDVDLDLDLARDRCRFAQFLFGVNRRRITPTRSINRLPRFYMIKTNMTTI